LRKPTRNLIAALALLLPAAASAETVLSVYGGFQGASSSVVSGVDDLGGPFSFDADWLGKSFAMPPYYGLRAEYLPNDFGWGFGLEFSHTKIYATDATLAGNGFPILEFTDGLNILTLNATYRTEKMGRFQPYVGGGVGLSIPHVEVQTRAGGPVTFEYQVGGPAARVLAGVTYELNENWSVFGELGATYSSNDVDLVGGGNLQTDIFTQAVNIGASFRF
jgi:lipid A oxidase